MVNEKTCHSNVCPEIVHQVFEGFGAMSRTNVGHKVDSNPSMMTKAGSCGDISWIYETNCGQTMGKDILRSYTGHK